MAKPLSECYSISGTVTATKHSYIGLHVYNLCCSVSTKLFIFLSFQLDELMNYKRPLRKHSHFTLNIGENMI